MSLSSLVALGMLLLPLQQFAATGELAPRPWVVTYPDRARDSLRTWMAASVKASPVAAEAILAQANRLGAEYLRVWGDSFPLRDVRRFTQSPARARVLRVRADSLRRSGNAALGRDGFDAAAKAWRASHAVAVALKDTALMASALGNLGTGFYGESQLDSAANYYTEARRLARVAGDQRTEMNALTGLASVSKDRGDFAVASQQYRQALYLRRQIGDYRGVAADADNLGLVAAATGQPAEARRRYLEALVTAREHGFDDAAAAALLNLGVLASSEGDERGAERRYREALSLYRKLEYAADEAAVLRNLGLLYSSNGEYDSAAAQYRDAVALLEQAGPAEALVGTQLDLAAVHAAMGKLDQADQVLRAADRAANAEALGPLVTAQVRIARGDLALQFNRVSQAGEFYQAALTLATKAKDRELEAEALAALGWLSLIEEDYPKARSTLARAAAQQQAEGDSRAAAMTGLLAGRAALALHDTADARRRMTAAVDSLRVSGDPVAHAWALCETGGLQLALGSLRGAEASYRAGIARLGRIPSVDAAVCLHGGLGRVLQRRGAGRDAIASFQRGIAEIEATATNVGTLGRRSDFLSDKWELYTELALAQRKMGDNAAAFATSERLRARQVLSLIGRIPGTGKVEASHPRAVALRRQIDELLGASPTPATVLALRGPEERLRNLARRHALAAFESEYSDLLDSLEAAGKSEVPPPTPAGGWRDIAARLPTDAALVEYLLTDSSALAFVVTRDSLAVVDLPTTGSELASEVDFIRGLLTPKASTSPGAWITPLKRLHGQLMTPLEQAGLLRGKGRLLIVPHRELHYLPFAALLEPVSNGQYLAQRYQIGHVASGAVWLRLRARPTATTGTSLLALAPQPIELPGARAEVRAIGSLYGSDARIVIGKEATRQLLSSAVRGRSILHLASRGVLNRHNPRFSYVALAPDHETDGRLEVHEVTRLAIDARLVVLSACQTGLGSGRLVDVPPGDDWVGLVQAFQSAGARNVLATLWPVDDRATAELIKEFYVALRASNSESRALAMAQRKVIAASPTRSPFYWAGLVLNGDLQEKD